MSDDPTLVERLRFWLTFHVRLVYRARAWRAARHGRPGFRASDYR